MRARERTVDEKRAAGGARQGDECHEHRRGSDRAEDSELGGGVLASWPTPPSDEDDERDEDELPGDEKDDQVERDQRPHRGRREKPEGRMVDGIPALGRGDDDRHRGEGRGKHDQGNAHAIDAEVKLGAQRPHPHAALDELEAVVSVHTPDPGGEAVVRPEREQKLGRGDSHRDVADERLVPPSGKEHAAREREQDERPEKEQHQDVLADPAEPRRQLRAKAHRHFACALVRGGHDDMPERLPHPGILVGHPGHDDVLGRAGRERCRRRRAIDESHAQAGGRSHVVLVAAQCHARHDEGLGADVGDRRETDPATLTLDEHEGAAGSVGEGEKQAATPGGGRLGPKGSSLPATRQTSQRQARVAT